MASTFTEEDEQKLRSGIDMILSQWPLLVGVMQTNWGEFDKKKLRLLPKMMDCTMYNFSKLPYTEIRPIFINELAEYMLRRLD